MQVGKTEAGRQAVTIRLAAVKKQAFPLTLEANVLVGPSAQSAAVPLLRFPRSAERDAEITVSVPAGQEVRGSAREWDGEQPAGWGQPLAPACHFSVSPRTIPGQKCKKEQRKRSRPSSACRRARPSPCMH